MIDQLASQDNTPTIQRDESSARQRFYFVEEVAVEMRRSEAAVRWLIQTGALKSARLAGRRVVTQKQLNEFFSEAFGDDA